MAVNYQTHNILEDFYMNNEFKIILTSTLNSNLAYFPELVNYCKTYIPTWQPILKNNKNRIVMSNDILVEIAFYKNLICIIPLYIADYTTYEKQLIKIKELCEIFIISECKKNVKLLDMLEYKLVLYTPTPNHTFFKPNIIKYNKTVLDTDLFIPMYETKPIKLNYYNIILNCVNSAKTNVSNEIVPMNT